MANNFLNVSWISPEVLRLLVNFLTVGEYFNTDYKKEFDRDFAVGETIQVKFPQRFIPVDGMGYQPQALNRISTTISLDQWIQVAYEVDDLEAALKMERSKAEIREQYLEPLAAAFSQEIDTRAAQFAKNNTNNVVGVLGTDPTGVSTYYNARRRLKELACPPGKRALCISSSMMSTFGQNITTFFQPPDELSKMFKEGALGTAAGFDWYESNSLFQHTAGTWAGAVTVTGGGQSGSTLSITGTNADTFKQGDKFSIANVNQVNPMTRRIPGPTQVKQFTVVQDFTLTAGPDTITFFPAIFGPGSQYQNVDALPAGGAALTLWPGTGSPNGKIGTVGLALSRYAFAMVGAKLFHPTSTELTDGKSDPKTGLSWRFVKAWDPVRSMQIQRADMLLGFGNLFQDNGACAVVGA